jgi:hypothetical protein
VGDGFADYDGAEFLQPRDNGCGSGGDVPGQMSRAAFGRHGGDVDDILDRDRDAVQRAARPVVPYFPVRGGRSGERTGPVDIGEGVDLGVHRVDPGERSLDEFGRGGRTGAQSGGRFADG